MENEKNIFIFHDSVRIIIVWEFNMENCFAIDGKKVYVLLLR